MNFYAIKDYRQAAQFFSSHHARKAQNDSDTTLLYLYNCYLRLNEIDKAAEMLEELVKRRTENENIYLNLYSYYQSNRDYSRVYNLVIDLPAKVRSRFDKTYVLTRKLFAELLYGAAADGSRMAGTNPLSYAVNQGFLDYFADGKLYENDTLKNRHVIMMFDSRLTPFYPKNFYMLKYVSNHSFLYLPYMRLLETGILSPAQDLDLNPDENASAVIVAQLIGRLKNNGLLK